MPKKVGGGFHVRPSDDAKILRELAKIANGGNTSGFKKLRDLGISFEQSEIGSRVDELWEHCTYTPPGAPNHRPKDPDKDARHERIMDYAEQAILRHRQKQIPLKQASAEVVPENPAMSNSQRGLLVNRIFQVARSNGGPEIGPKWIERRRNAGSDWLSPMRLRQK